MIDELRRLLEELRLLHQAFEHHGRQHREELELLIDLGRRVNRLEHEVAALRHPMAIATPASVQVTVSS